MRNSRAEVDAALANGGRVILGENATRLTALRARIKAGGASEIEVRSFFIRSIAARSRA